MCGGRNKGLKTERIPEAVVRRLPLYLRYLSSLQQKRFQTVSSQTLGSVLDLNPAQIRKDLAYFGAFGRKGVGYEVDYLVKKIKQILKLDREINIVLVGAGNLGHAIGNYKVYLRENLKIVAVFDADRSKIGKTIAGVKIQPIEELPETVKRTRARMGLITVPAQAAQDVADRLTEAGIEAILNFAPVHIKTDPNVKVLQMDLTTELQRLAYYLKEEGEVAK